MNEDERMMKVALELAAKGRLLTAPNPMVGCVITNHSVIVSSGFHEYFGGPHAEVSAIRALPQHIHPADCTLYVSLEPCSHYGKTPPCTNLITETGFKKVVVACNDPNPLVNGKGIQRLKEAGIEVVTGVLEEDAKDLNRHFFTYHIKKRPYIYLKWAQSRDGFISGVELKKIKITGDEADKVVHQLRAECMGIMVGKNTVLNDNPVLTTRLLEGHNPLRITLDKNLEMPLSLKIFNPPDQTIFFNSIKDEETENIRRIRIDFEENVLTQVTEKLYDLKINSLLVEGGALLLSSFLNENLWDEMWVFENPDLVIREGTKAPTINFVSEPEVIGRDKLYRIKNKR